MQILNNKPEKTEKMNIYRLKPLKNSHEVIDLDLFKFAEAIGDQNLSLVRSQPRTNESLLARWQPTTCSLSIEYKNNKPIPDVSFKGSYLLMTDLAHNEFKSLLEDDGEFLPIQVDDKKMYIYNCLSFGEEDKKLCASKYEDGYEADLETLVFDIDDIKRKTVFKSKIDGARSLFTTDIFKSIFDENNFKGLTFDCDLTNIFS